MPRLFVLIAVVAACSAGPARAQSDAPPDASAETLTRAVALCLRGVREDRDLPALTSPGLTAGDRPGVRPDLSGVGFVDDLEGPTLRLSGPGEVYVSKGAYCAVGVRGGTGPTMAEAAAQAMETDAAAWTRSPTSRRSEMAERAVYCADGAPDLATVVRTPTEAAGETDMTLTAMITAVPRHVDALCPD